MKKRTCSFYKFSDCRQSLFLKLNYQCVLVELSPVISKSLLVSLREPSRCLRNVNEMISTARTNGSKEPFVTLVV